MFNSNSDEHKENNKNSTEFQMDICSYSTIKIDINHHKLLNLSFNATNQKEILKTGNVKSLQHSRFPGGLPP